MSEHYITLIPVIPDFIPESANLEEAKKLSAAFFNSADEIEAIITDEIRFVDQGENFERVRCPRCRARDWR